MSEIKAYTDVILKELADRYRAEIQDEELEEKSTSEQTSSYEGDQDAWEAPILPVINLATIPVGEWDTLKVSKVSTFSDMKWDWREEGSPLYRDSTYHNWSVNLENGLPLLLEEHAPLIAFMRALLFYWMPQNAVFVRVKSFNSTAIAGYKLLILGRFLALHNIYIDQHENGKFKIVNSITPELFHSYYEKLSNVHDRIWFIQHVRHWRRLSQAGLLPPDFQLGYEVFDAEAVSKGYKEFDDSKTPFQPLKLETLSVLVPRCFDIIDNYGEDILFAYDLFWPVIRGTSKGATSRFDWHHALLQLEQRETSLWEMKQFIDPSMGMSHSARMKLRQEIRRHPGWKSSTYFHTGIRLKSATKEDVKSIAIELGINLKEFNRAIYYDLSKVRQAVVNMATTLRNACAVIIFLVTGMRRSELGNLESGCCRVSSDESGGYRLRFLVFKTSDQILKAMSRTFPSRVSHTQRFATWNA